MASPFEILGVDPDADDEAITRAYRQRVKAAHPDQGGSLAEFQRVRDAYERLRNGDHSGDLAPRDEVSPDGHGTVDPEATADEADPPAEEGAAEPAGPTVEYLNYEVLDDHGWSLADEDLFEKAAGADLDDFDYGEFTVESRKTLLEAAENHGLAWPFACRGGACANCAVAVVDGEMAPAADDLLSGDMLDRGIRLSCLSGPATDSMRVVYNVKHLPDLDELRLPADRFERAYPTDD